MTWQMTDKDQRVRACDVMTERSHPSGAWACSALVTDDATGFGWYHTQSYYGFTKREAVARFVTDCAERGFRLAVMVWEA